ncbi:putative gustatory receptor 28b [Wyeomyia smithii]|uniref:putative gustatory receptor 28b n=1 Tax=Wyeomyia smithii TaxID=174621 RepID=UPI002467D954|nr:putative gustatory receptor 28b [Wyeomyia smithii]
MRWFRVDNFFQSIRPVYLAAKLFLLHFETLDFDKRTRRRTLLDQIRFVLSLVLDLFLTLVALQNITIMMTMSDSILLNMGYYGSFLLSCLVSAAIPSWNSWQADSLFELYDNIATVDEKLKQIGIFIDHQKHHLVSTLVTIFAILIPVFMFTITTYMYFFETSFAVARLFPDFIMIVPSLRAILISEIHSCYLMLTLLSLRNRFAVLNETIKQHFQTVDNTEYYDRIIRNFADLHDLLSDTVEIYNSCFSVQAMILLTANFGFTLFALFGVVHATASRADEITLQVAWSNTIFAVIPMSFLLQMVLYSGLVHCECKQTAVLIHKVISNGEHSRKIFRELRGFSQQLQHHAPKVSCKVFNFDWTLFYTLASSLTTYLVILVQFDLINLNITKHN